MGLFNKNVFHPRIEHLYGPTMRANSPRRPPSSHSPYVAQGGSRGPQATCRPETRSYGGVRANAPPTNRLITTASVSDRQLPRKPPMRLPLLSLRK